MHDPKLSYYIGCYYWHICANIHKSLNHPIIDLHKQVHGFPSISFIHINPSNIMGIIDNCNFLPISSIFFFLDNLTNPSRYSNSLGVFMIVSMGVRKIRPFIKCRRIFYLGLESGIASMVLYFASMPSAYSTIPSTSLAYIKNFLVRILFPNDKWSLAPQILFSYVNVASSSLTNTSR